MTTSPGTAADARRRLPHVASDAGAMREKHGRPLCRLAEADGIAQRKVFHAPDSPLVGGNESDRGRVQIPQDLGAEAARRHRGTVERGNDCRRGELNYRREYQWPRGQYRVSARTRFLTSWSDR